MQKIPPITEGEWQIMTRLWDRYPLTAIEIVETPLDGKTMPDATVRTLLRRLVAKKIVGYTVDDKNSILYHYYPMVCERDCVLQESKHFLKTYFRNNMSSLFAAFVDDMDMSDEEIDRLKNMLDAKKGEIE